MKKLFLILSILILIGLNSNSQSWNWLTPDGSPNNDVGKHLAIDAGHNVAAAGVFRDSIFSGNNMQISRGGDDVFIAKYDSLGTLLWSRSGGGLSNDGEYSMGVTFDSNGNIYVLCYVIGNVIFPPDTLQNASGGILLLKYDGSGNHIFSKIFGGKEQESANMMRATV